MRQPTPPPCFEDYFLFLLCRHSLWPITNTFLIGSKLFIPVLWYGIQRMICPYPVLLLPVPSIRSVRAMVICQKPAAVQIDDIDPIRLSQLCTVIAHKVIGSIIFQIAPVVWINVAPFQQFTAVMAMEPMGFYFQNFLFCREGFTVC